MSSSNQAAPPRKSRGRQKVTMAKMSNESNLQVTFSKRRAGLFKKASELCTLCGSEASIVVFSPANKVFCFGHPNVQTVIDKFDQFSFPQTPAPCHNARSQLIIEAHRNSTIRELNLELTQVESVLRAEKRRAEELDLLRKSGQVEGWFFGSLDGFNSAQLAVLKDSITGFKKNLDVKVQNDMFALANPNPYPPPPPAGNNIANPPIFNNFSDNWVPATLNNNVQMLLASSIGTFNPNFNYDGAVWFGDNVNIGPYGGPANVGTSAANYGTIDEANLELDDPMSNNNGAPNVGTSVNYGTIDEALEVDDPMSNNINGATTYNNLQVPSDYYYYQNGGGNNNNNNHVNITGFGSYTADQGFDNMSAPFDPSFF